MSNYGHPQAFGLWQSELGFVEEMIDRDVRNNSAWSQRAYVLKCTLEAGISTAGESGRDVAAAASGSVAAAGQSGRGPIEGVLEREIRYVATKIALAPRNESSWNYLLGLFVLPGCCKHEMAWWNQVPSEITQSVLSHVDACAL